MTQIASWLLAMVAPLVVRAIISLGFTTMVYTGVTELVNSLIATAQNNWASMPLTALQLGSLAGLPEALGMVMGAYLGLLALWAAKGTARFVLKSS